MNIVPIVFSFDERMAFPASVCISSLAKSANPETFYDIFILYGGELPHLEEEDKLCSAYPNIRITYRSVGTAFADAFEIRGVTKATYYRLLAAECVPEYDKLIYSDVDVIFQLDLMQTYSRDMGDNLLGAVPARRLAITRPKQIGLRSKEYFCAGFLLINGKKIREEKITDLFKKKAEHNYKYQDMDVLNIVCEGRIMSLSVRLCMGIIEFYGLEVSGYYDSKNDDDKEILRKGSIIHYNGPKPWNTMCPNFDIWWEYYRKSPIFDPKKYFAFFYNKLEELDQLSFKKRLKILLRFFVFGRKKSEL